MKRYIDSHGMKSMSLKLTIWCPHFHWTFMFLYENNCPLSLLSRYVLFISTTSTPIKKNCIVKVDSYCVQCKVLYVDQFFLNCSFWSVMWTAEWSNESLKYFLPTNVSNFFLNIPALSSVVLTLKYMKYTQHFHE